MKTFLVAITVLVGCTDNKTKSVQSPFSHLDTVTTVIKEEAEIEKNDGSPKSPFSGLDKK
jgi:hypothetical protein